MVKKATPPRKGLLARQVLLVGVLVALLSGGSIAFWLSQKLSEKLIQDGQQHASEIARVVGLAMETAAHRDDVQRFVDVIGAEKNITQLIVVAGSPPKVLASTHAEWVEKPLDSLPALGNERARIVHAMEHKSSHGALDESSKYYHIAQPILLRPQEMAAEGVTRGAVYVKLDMSQERAEATKLNAKLILSIEAALLLITLLGAFVVFRGVSKPIDAVVETIERRTKGDASARAPSQVENELTHLARTVNDAFDIARAKEQESQRLKEELEHRIEERTRELKKQSERTALATEAAGLGTFEYIGGRGALHFDLRAKEILGLAENPSRAVRVPKVPDDAPSFANALAANPTLQDAFIRIHPDDRAAVALQMEPGGPPSSNRREKTRLSFRVILRDGEMRFIQLLAMRLRANDGTVERTIGVLLDETDQRRASLAVLESRDALEVANRELSRTARMKDEFLANMSHELRTPLNAVLGLSELLKDGYLGSMTEKQRDAAATIHSSGSHLLALINDILDISKIGAGKLALDLAPVNADEISQQSLLMVENAAKERGIVVTYSANMEDLQVVADARRLKQCLLNLLSNAIKFTLPGGRVGLQVVADPTAQSITFTVWDTGIGIAKEALGLLFQPFVQIDSGHARNYEGTGLGLTLTRRLVELHGGSVDVESEPGKGSHFHLTLPWCNATTWSDTNQAGGEPSTAPERITHVPALAAKPLVLIVEDSLPSVEPVLRYLEAKRYTTVHAPSGEAALELVRTKQPTLILMDIQLSGMDGLEAIRKLRADPTIPRIPIIALTALAMPRDKQACLDAGADAYLTKPVSFRELSKAMRQLMRR